MDPIYLGDLRSEKTKENDRKLNKLSILLQENQIKTVEDYLRSNKDSLIVKSSSIIIVGKVELRYSSNDSISWLKIDNTRIDFQKEKIKNLYMELTYELQSNKLRTLINELHIRTK